MYKYRDLQANTTRRKKLSNIIDADDKAFETLRLRASFSGKENIKRGI